MTRVSKIQPLVDEFVRVLNLDRDKKIVRREPGRDGKILCDHRQDGNDEVHRLKVRLKKKERKKCTPVQVMGQMANIPTLAGDKPASGVNGIRCCTVLNK